MEYNKFLNPSYWTQLIQLMLYKNIKKYLEDNHISQKDFAQKLCVSKGYVSQILNGDFDHKLSKMVELSLACNMVPKIEFVPLKYAENITQSAYLKPIDWKTFAEHYISYEQISRKDNKQEKPADYIKLPSYYSNMESSLTIWHTVTTDQNITA